MFISDKSKSVGETSLKHKLTKLKKKRIILTLIFILTFLLVFLHFQFRPIVKEISLSRARIISTDAVNEAILEELSQNSESYINIIRIQKNENGELTAILSDMEKVNRLKSQVGLIIQNKLSELKSKNMKISLGTLSGLEMFNGMGPEVPFKISIAGSVITEFKSTFKDAGINQTIYQIYLNIHTRIGVMVPGCTCSEDFSTNALVSETVILGAVPRVYSGNGKMNVNSGEAA